MVVTSNVQIENVEVAQSKTASEIKELRNHHSQSRKRLEKLENDVEDVSGRIRHLVLASSVMQVRVLRF